MRKLAFGFMVGLLWGAPLVAQPSSPAAATVFIRVIGQIRAEYRKTWEESIERREVELGTGSGFVISPYGHVLTNYHVIGDREVTRQEGDTEVTIKVEVEQVEVVFPGGTDGDGARRFTASIDAVDPVLDLAVLSINGADLTYVPFGDSTAIGLDEPVQVLGYPFGKEVEVAKVKIPEIVPRVSASKGTVSSLRADEEGRDRYIQTNATMNPGNSGGPLVDKEGYALGVVRMKLTEAENVGFAVSIDVVKDFLESHGLDSLLLVKRLRLGPAQRLEGKGVHLQLPQGLEDISRQRLLADSGESLEGVKFRLDRVFSPWGISELEGLLLSGQAFESFSAGSAVSAGPDLARNSSDGVEYGEVTGRVPNREGTWKMAYAVFDLGAKEKLVARYLGDAEHVAFNRGVFQKSLASMEAQRLLVREVKAVPQVVWEAVSLPGARSRSLLQVMMPTEWILEPGAPFPCPEAPPLEAALAASPPGDFTVSLRSAWWSAGNDTPQTAAASCSNRRGRLGEPSYTFDTDWLGIRYTVQGSFVSFGDGLLQLEVVAPAEKAGYLTQVFTAWVRENSR